jgi:hypothetical protein
LELLWGEDRKFDCDDAKDAIPAWDEIQEKFARHGISFISDASFFLMPDGGIKLVDIAMQDILGIGAGWQSFAVGITVSVARSPRMRG